MRIIAGKYRSRQLKSLRGMELRPTSDRLRETLFNILGERVIGARFVDIFAGTGAVGIEALSRGAGEAVFIEKHAPAAALIKKNLESLEVREGARVLPIDAIHALEKISKENSNSADVPDIVFLDPPYDHAEDYQRVLSFLGSVRLFGDGSLVVAEHCRKFELPESRGWLQRVRVLRQGDAALSFYRLMKNHPASEAASE
jgi:16S rRNA (guanine(966)-N(2))-methyltransferase RsmD